MPNISLFWYFIGTALIAMSFGVGLLLLVRAGKKSEQEWERAIEQEPWRTRIRVVRDELDLDEYERNLGGNISKLEECQSN